MKPNYSTAAAAGGMTGALAVILIWLASLVHVDVPPEVVAALMVVLTPLLHWLALLMSRVSDDAPKAPPIAAPPPPAAT